MEQQAGNIKFAAWMAGPAGRIARIVNGAPWKGADAVDLVKS